MLINSHKIEPEAEVKEKPVKADKPATKTPVKKAPAKKDAK